MSNSRKDGRRGGGHKHCHAIGGWDDLSSPMSRKDGKRKRARLNRREGQAFIRTELRQMAVDVQDALQELLLLEESENYLFYEMLAEEQDERDRIREEQDSYFDDLYYDEKERERNFMYADAFGYDYEYGDFY